MDIMPVKMVLLTVFHRLFHEMITIKTNLIKSRNWLLVNFLGIAVHFLIQHWILTRSLGEESPGFNQVYYWMNLECPLLLLFLVINLFWLIKTIKEMRSSKNWLPLALFCGICLAWVMALFAGGITRFILQLFALLAKEG